MRLIRTGTRSGVNLPTYEWNRFKRTLRQLPNVSVRTEAGRSHLLPLFGQFGPMACELFELPPGCSADDLVAAGVMTRPVGDQRAEWQATVDDTLAEAGYRPPWPDSGETATPYGGRAGQRSPHFPALHAEMVEVLSIDPSARW